MNYFTNTLKNYYTRKKGKVIFTNGKSLNQVSLQMWEYLNYSQIDASVLSKVINGKRLFSMQQLEAFCRVLSLSTKDKEKLFYNLNKDYCLKYNITLDIFYHPKSEFVKLIHQFLEQAYKLNYEGRPASVIDICNKIESFIQSLNVKSSSITIAEELDKITAVYLYLRTKALGTFFSPDEALKITTPVSNKLISLSKIYDDKIIYSYSLLLLAHAYYLAAQNETNPNFFYIRSMAYAKKTLIHLPIDHWERIFALGLISRNAAKINDKETFEFLFNEFNRILPYQPQNNDISLYLFSGTLAKGAALLHHSNPFVYKESVLKYFGPIILEEKGLHDISYKKREIETYLQLGSSDKFSLIELAKEGQKISQRHKLMKYYDYFTTFSHS